MEDIGTMIAGAGERLAGTGVKVAGVTVAETAGATVVGAGAGVTEESVTGATTVGIATGVRVTDGGDFAFVIKDYGSVFYGKLGTLRIF